MLGVSPTPRRPPAHSVEPRHTPQYGRTILTASMTRSGLIQASATKLYHEVRGSGPALLITGGTGDAGEWANLAPTLAEECTVVTYDRRGMSRSPRPDGWTATSVAEAADDAAALLHALNLAPAVAGGHGRGAGAARGRA